MVVARLALVAVFLLGQLGGLIHQATVAHARCAEHGELVHADAGEGGAAGATGLAGRVVQLAASSDSGSAPQAMRESGAGLRHRHDHCMVPFGSHERATGRSSSVALAGDDPAPPRSAIPVVLDRGSRFELFRVAPKTSPPA